MVSAVRKTINPPREIIPAPISYHAVEYSIIVSGSQMLLSCASKMLSTLCFLLAFALVGSQAPSLTATPTASQTGTQSTTPSPVFRFLGSSTDGFTVVNATGVTFIPDQCGVPGAAANLSGQAYLTYMGNISDVPSGNDPRSILAWISCTPTVGGQIHPAPRYSLDDTYILRLPQSCGANSFCFIVHFGKVAARQESGIGVYNGKTAAFVNNGAWVLPLLGCLMSLK